jgi:hypothetical protein
MEKTVKENVEKVAVIIFFTIMALLFLAVFAIILYMGPGSPSGYLN